MVMMSIISPNQVHLVYMYFFRCLSFISLEVIPSLTPRKADILSLVCVWANFHGPRLLIPPFLSHLSDREPMSKVTLSQEWLA